MFTTNTKVGDMQFLPCRLQLQKVQKIQIAAMLREHTSVIKS